MDALTVRIPALALLALCLPLTALPLAEQQPSEYQVKAAFVFKFTGFVDWPAPAEPAAPFELCIAGEDPFGKVLDQLVEGEAVNGRRIVVRRIHSVEQGSCSLIFVSSKEPDIGEILAAAGTGVLTIGEGDSFLDQGGMIAFVLENRKVRFDIDASAVRKAGLKMSSRLLSVARIVR